MRVVAGVWRGRPIPTPAQPDTRPTADRTREAIFNMAYGLGLPQDATVIDAFCGSGALGIEALSRGAAHTTFIDNNASLCDALHQTLEGFEADPSTYRIICADAVETLTNLPPPNLPPSAQSAQPDQPAPDLLLADPPYDSNHWPDLLQLTPGVLIAEAPQYLQAPSDSHWTQYRCRRYGRAHITILQHRLRYRQPSE